jgi:hypothetical protein
MITSKCVCCFRRLDSVPDPCFVSCSKTSDVTEKLSFELRRRRVFSQLLGTSQIEFSALAQCQGQGVLYLYFLTSFSRSIHL